MSTSRRVNLQPAFILHRRPFRDTSLLLEGLTPEQGRIGLVARGVRRSRSKLAGLLQPFQPLWLSWSGSGELFTLTGAEARDAPAPLSGNALVAGFYLNELLIRLVPRHDPQPELFEAYGVALSKVAGDAGEWALRLFEKRLLEGLGYGLNLTHEVSTGRHIQPDERYCYHLESGALPVGDADCTLSIHGRTLLALESDADADEQMRAEAKRLMRAALGLYLGDKPLKSRELFQRISANSAEEAR